MRMSEFRRAGHTPSLVAALLHFDISFAIWVILGALGAYIAEDLGLTAAEKGVLVADPAAVAPRSAASRSASSPTASARAGSARSSMTHRDRCRCCGAGSARTTMNQLLGVGVLLGVAGASFAISPAAGEPLVPAAAPGPGHGHRRRRQLRHRRVRADRAAPGRARRLARRRWASRSSPPLLVLVAFRAAGQGAARARPAPDARRVRARCSRERHVEAVRPLRRDVRRLRRPLVASCRSSSTTSTA